MRDFVVQLASDQLTLTSRLADYSDDTNLFKWTLVSSDNGELDDGPTLVLV